MFSASRFYLAQSSSSVLRRQTATTATRSSSMISSSSSSFMMCAKNQTSMSNFSSSSSSRVGMLSRSSSVTSTSFSTSSFLKFSSYISGASCLPVAMTSHRFALAGPSEGEQINAANKTRPDIRNIAIVAHVDHGKTTLCDSLLKMSGTMANARNRVMDNNDQEKERGITILAKNTSVILDGGKRRINIVDTPGHLDFSGEVERTLQTVEGFILLVDAAEGCKPGTRYVLRKALQLNLKPIVIVNKIDKDASKIDKVKDDVENLFLDTAISDDQLDMTFLYGSGRDGYINREPVKGGDLSALWETIFDNVPAPSQPDVGSPLQMLVSQVAEEGDLKALTGHIFRGTVKVGDVVKVMLGDKQCDALVREMRSFVGVEQAKVDSAAFGDNVILKLQEPKDGVTKIPLQIGASVCDPKNPNPWPYKAPDDPTFSLYLCECTAPWKEKELKDANFGRWNEICKRLRLESLVNTALKVEFDMEKRQVLLSGRGPLHLSVILESMRREGYAFELKAPRILTKVIDGEVYEPYEKVYMDFKEKLAPDVIGLLVQRQAEVGDLTNISDGRVAVECSLPVRMMLNLPLEFNRLTIGDGVLNHSTDGFKKQIVAPEERESGALIAIEAGEVQSYSINNLAKHGTFFVQAGDDVQYGQIVGENTQVRLQDVPVNVTKKNEQLGGMRANANDAAKRNKAVAKYQPMPIEQMLNWMHHSETIAITPASIRLRKPGFTGKTMNRAKAKN